MSESCPTIPRCGIGTQCTGLLLQGRLREGVGGPWSAAPEDPPRLPVVLDVKEVMTVLDKIDKRYSLMARIQYGGGLRLHELVTLRVKDVDEGRGMITIRNTKGDKHRTTVLPVAVREEIAERKKELRELHEKDRADGLPGVALPNAYDRKDRRAGEKWPWHWMFDKCRPPRYLRLRGSSRSLLSKTPTSLRRFSGSRHVAGSGKRDRPASSRAR